MKSHFWTKALWTKALWITVIIGLIATMPILAERAQREASAKKVELIMDYDDIRQMAARTADPNAASIEKLKQLKEAGITTIAVSDRTLKELAIDGVITYFSGSELRLAEQISATKPIASTFNDNYTYIFPRNLPTATALYPLIKHTFSEAGVDEVKLPSGTQAWAVHMPVSVAEEALLPPNPFTMAKVKAQGLEIIARLSNSDVYQNLDYLNRVLTDLKDGFGVDRIAFSGDEALGYPDRIPFVAELMKQHEIGTANIEFTPQDGLKPLSDAIGYNTVRLHSIKKEEMKTYDIQRIVDRMELAVTERNIRELYLHVAMQQKPGEPLTIDFPKTLSAIAKTKERLEQGGYQFGAAQPFADPINRFDRILTLFVAIGAIALIALTLQRFWAPLSLLTVGGGVALLAAGVVLSKTLLVLKLLALGAGVSGATLGTMIAITYISNRFGSDRPLWISVKSFLLASVFSLIGAIFIVGMLHHISFSLYLDIFSGVKMLHLLPVVAIGVFIVLFTKLSWTNLLKEPVRFYHVGLAIVLAGMGLYYVMRTGNDAEVSNIERIFRTVLQDVLAVRPRTKEILFGHPLFIIAAYWFIKSKQPPYLFIAAIIGQLSMVSTFTHLHTPLWASAVRDLLGIAIGLALGIVAVWVLRRLVELVGRRWSLNKS